MSAGTTRDPHLTEDERLLHKLGYAQELFRAMGGFQNFAISFTIISILAGCLTSYYIAFESGGPIAVTWGWLIVGVFSTIISLAMAEIASSFPTAGGLYYWASKLGSPGWGWATGWFNLIGQIAVTAAIGYGLSTFATSLFDDLFSFEKHLNDWFGFSYNETVYALYAVFLLAACLINVFDVRITSMLNTVSAYWHMAGVAVIVDRADRRSGSPSVGRRTSSAGTANATGYGGTVTGFHHAAFWLVFGLGLLMAQYTITGFDASAHMAEETQQASRIAAVGMYMSVVVSVDLRVHPARRRDLRRAEHEWCIDEHRDGRAVDLVDVHEPELVGCIALHLHRRAVLLRHRLDDIGVAHDVRVLARRRGARPLVLAARLQASCACPRGFRHRRPSALLMVPAHLELPRRLRGRNGDRRDRALHRIRPAGVPPAAARRPVRAGAWSLGKHYKWIDVDRARVGRLHHRPLQPAALQGGLPWESDFSWSLTNYTVLWFAGIGLFFGGWWVVSAKNWFKGPVRMGTEEELEQIERGADASSSEALRARRKAFSHGCGRRAPRGALRLGLDHAAFPLRRRRRFHRRSSRRQPTGGLHRRA